jgi:steroid Delta-isomerase
MKSTDPRVQTIIERFEGLREADVPRLAEIYSDGAFFKDPFNEVRGVAPILRIFGHMFTALEAPRFEIHDAVVQGNQCFLTWDFVFRMKRLRRDEQRIRGGSHLVLAADGRISSHRDYWDAAEELYEKLPVLGALMRWLKRRVNS